MKLHIRSVRGAVTTALGQCPRLDRETGLVPQCKTKPEALTILTQVQLGQAPAIKGLLKDGAGVPVAHCVQVHGLVLHSDLQQQQEGWRGERRGRREAGERDNKL